MKYEVIRPWYGVSKGEIVTLKELHPAIKANVRPVGKIADLTPATPDATSEKAKPAKTK